ncbi:hypothetical protein ACFSTA_18600 [Ornithinibacillus salinisoli]|uniref:Uncharacterized protein n=1 Tax=Ornithinibacillus salinisoli TaxID=1848459 RepID=A0ABW4W366_9BACI
MLKIGDQVIHEEYGGGEVVHINGDWITVAFDKKVDSSYGAETDQFYYRESEETRFKEVLSAELKSVTMRLIDKT